MEPVLYGKSVTVPNYDAIDMDMDMEIGLAIFS
jgi:hypothetical protein